VLIRCARDVPGGMACCFVAMSALVCWFVAHAMYLVARLQAELANAGGAGICNGL
jgi:hypothetical protein